MGVHGTPKVFQFSCIGVDTYKAWAHQIECDSDSSGCGVYEGLTLCHPSVTKGSVPAEPEPFAIYKLWKYHYSWPVIGWVKVLGWQISKLCLIIPLCIDNKVI